MTGSSDRELGIYVHLPFCRVRCSYCAFAISTDRGKEARYADALLREIGLRAITRTAASTVYFGGGTPSKSSPEFLARIAERLRVSYDAQNPAEFTLEANPEDVTPDMLAAFREIGVTRLSIGVQSFHDAELFPLGRGHSRAIALTAVSAAVAAGFRTTLDLMIGLPGQTRASFAESLQTAIDLGIGHLSIYMLDLEAGSALERQVRFGRVQIPEDEDVGRIYLDAVDAAGTAGLVQYEISNFARDGEESLHNLKYWNREPYVGLGLGAHSQLGDERFANTRDLDEYLERLEAGSDAIDFREALGPAEIRRERLFLALRQTSGIGYAALNELCGPEASAWLERGIGEGWLRERGDRVGFTPAGFLLSNSYISELF
ncbi:MAG: radical SAM family heme chaperone HemW [Thermoanaerobaculia bacterium]